MPYAEEDAAFFFGRKPEQEIIAANLQAYRLTLLYGPSGVGKSSVLRAGVAHHLRQLADHTVAERGTREFVVVVFSSWRDDAVAHLTARIRDSVNDGSVQSAPATVPASPSLVETLASWTTHVDSELLIILDQFEEYFLYHPQEDGEGSFAVEFPRAISRPGLRANFLISIREDALAKLDRFKGRIPNLFDNYLRIDHLDRDAARAAIEKPIEQFNRCRASATSAVSLEPALIDAVLKQVRTGQVLLGDAGQGGIGTAAQASTEQRIETPYLQLVMTRLWKEERGSGSNVLRLDTLNRFGGADRIVRTHLDDVMNGLTPAERQAASRVFRYLVTPSGTKIAHTISDLADYAALPESQLEPMAEKLSGGDVRIIRPIAPSPEKPTVPRYEIFHDVLAPAILDWRHRAEAERRTLVERTLEPLHRGTWVLTLLFLADSLLLTAPLTVAIADDPESPLWVLPGWFLGTIAFVGLVSAMATVGRLLVVWRRITDAVRLGFRWRTIADVLADRRGDIGALIARTSKYSALNPITSGRIRLLRRLEAAVTLGAAGAPLLGLLAVVVLGSQELLMPSSIPALVLWPSAILVAIGLSVLLLEAVVLRRSRRPAKGQGRGLGLASYGVGQSPAEWFEGVAPNSPRSSSIARARQVGWLIHAALAVLIASLILLTFPIAITTVLGPVVWEIVTPARGRVEGSIKLAQIGLPYRLPSDPGISPLAAGQAYYTLEQAGRVGDRQPYEHPVPRRIDQGWPLDLRNSPFAKESENALFDSLLTRAAIGFTTDEAAYLERIASHPGLAEVSIVARAPEVDYLGARFVSQHSLAGFSTPLPSLVAVRGVGYAHLAQAALHLVRGRRSESEATLREMISFGLAVAYDGHSLIELLMGGSIVERGLKGLETVYSLTGQDSRASALRTDRELATAPPEDLQGLPTLDAFRSADVVNARRTLMSIIRDRQHLRSERWEALNILAYAPCTNARELIFGPSEELGRSFDIARTSLVRFPSEQRLFDNIRATTELPVQDQNIQHSGVLPAITIVMARWSGWVFRNPRLMQCGTLLVMV
jgi:hypothetical protein